jgi:hypothetical protein
MTTSPNRTVAPAGVTRTVSSQVCRSRFRRRAGLERAEPVERVGISTEHLEGASRVVEERGTTAERERFVESRERVDVLERNHQAVAFGLQLCRSGGGFRRPYLGCLGSRSRSRGAGNRVQREGENEGELRAASTPDGPVS